MSKSEKIQLVKKIILKELNKIKNIDPKELKDAKTYLEGKFLLDIDDNRKESISLVDWEMIKDSNLVYDYLKNINKVTQKDVVRVAKKYFDNNYTLVTIES